MKNELEELAKELCSACQQLLDCPDLNFDELADFSVESIERAEAAINSAKALGITPDRNAPKQHSEI